MYYELIVLGRLMYAPYHGYLIMHVISEMLGPWQKVSAGTLYPLLGRLERDGLIQATVAVDSDPSHRRTARVFAITYAGRARFSELMLDHVSSIGEYQRLFYLKVPHLEFLSNEEKIQLLEHYRDYCRAALRHQDRITHELEARLGNFPDQSPAEAGGVTQSGISNGIVMTRHML
ncbi:MAG: PadR family transcriptional regulator, partial [Roseiflexaceae bacterium]